MAQNRSSPYGNWISPISAAAVAGQSFSAGFEDIILDQANLNVYYAQKRPEEEDRQDLFDGSWDARTQVHEYGGAAAVVFDSILYFSNFTDKRVYKCEKGGKPIAVTPDNPAHRFADFTVHPKHPALIVSILEDHTNPHPKEVKTYLVLINTSTSTVTKVADTTDFYLCPRFSPDGEHLLWQQCAFPDMPFQSSEIKVANVSITNNGETLNIENVTHVAGEHEKVSAQDPSWASNNCLFFVSDISGYHNPWKFTFEDALSDGKASPILPEPVPEEFMVPQWWMNRSTSGALSEKVVAFMSMRKGRSALYLCDLQTGNAAEVPTPYAQIEFVRGSGQGKVIFLGQPADAHEELVSLTLDAQGQPKLTPVLPPSGGGSSSLPLNVVSPGEYHALKHPPDSRTCHVTYYAPHNPNYDGGLPGEKPPIAVNIHGGPWYMESANLNWTKQFYTSRGWAFVDINYGGSTGFGRAFRETLVGKWGILDIHDAHEAVLKLDSLGLADAKRAVVFGGSAGGYSVLQIATTLPKAFAAGSPHYGIGDMRKLDEILHKFEYYLCDRLMGGTYEECPEVWKARSPIFHVDKVEMPLLILQGKEDTVIPAEQMIEVEQTLKAKGCKVELILFDGEGHGWRKASTVQTKLERSLEFFNEVLGLQNSA